MAKKVIVAFVLMFTSFVCLSWLGESNSQVNEMAEEMLYRQKQLETAKYIKPQAATLYPTPKELKDEKREEKRDRKEIKRMYKHAKSDAKKGVGEEVDAVHEEEVGTVPSAVDEVKAGAVPTATPGAVHEVEVGADPRYMKNIEGPNKA